MPAPRPALLLASERIGYREARDEQRRLAALRAAGQIPDVLWVLEHPPTYTYGRHGRRQDLYLDDAALAARGAEVIASDRGGQMTWHGPGQTVLYAICDLRPGRRVRAFVDAMIAAMRVASGLDGAEGGAGATGLYVEGRKLGSVGIRVSGGITSHGLALNRDCDLGWFSAMTACGAPGVAATSIAAEGGIAARSSVEEALAGGLARGLGLRLDPDVSIEGLVAVAGRASIAGPA